MCNIIDNTLTIHPIMALVYDSATHNTNATHNMRKGRVLRFEFSGALIEHVTAFTNLHQYDDRKTYKEAWQAWMANDEIAALIRTEVARLSALGYNGDVTDKLFKSGRYYFRGKSGAKDNATNDNATNANTNRKYVLLNRQLLDAMDDHIECGLRKDAQYTPASGFDEFCKMNYAAETVFKSEITRLSELMPTGEAVHAKLKKTYKNRYFTLSNNKYINK